MLRSKNSKLNLVVNCFHIVKVVNTQKCIIIMREKITNKIDAWAETLLGKKIISMEEQCLFNYLSKCFGYFFLQIGYWPYELISKKINFNSSILCG